MNRFTTAFTFCAIALLHTGLAAQGSFTPFGTGCTFQNQTPAIGNRSVPSLGRSFTITYSGPNTTGSSAQQIAQPFLVLGLNTQNLPLPTNLLPMQPAGCTALITTDAILQTPPDRTLPIFVPAIDVTIPNQPGLLGVTFFAQWATLFQQCGFAGCDLAAALTSDAAVAVIGP